MSNSAFLLHKTIVYADEYLKFYEELIQIQQYRVVFYAFEVKISTESCSHWGFYVYFEQIYNFLGFQE